MTAAAVPIPGRARYPNRNAVLSFLFRFGLHRFGGTAMNKAGKAGYVPLEALGARLMPRNPPPPGNWTKVQL